MAKKVYCSCYNSTHAGYFHLFAEKSDGHFGHNIGSPTDGVEVESSSTKQIVVVAVPKIAGKYCSQFQNVSSGATVTNYGILTNTGSYSYSYSNKAYGNSSSSGIDVTVVDEHGTHSGTPTGTNKFYSNHAVGVFHETTNSGYVFTGWKVDFYRASGATYPQFLSTFSSGEATTSGTVTTVSAAYAEKNAIIVRLGTSSTRNVTFTALYETGTVKHTLTYNANGGSPTPSSVTAETGSTFTLASAPTKSGYNFDGWLITGESTARGAGTNYTMPAQDVTATAQWSTASRTYYLYYNLNGGSPSYSSQNCKTGGYITLSGNPTKSRYDFAGWTITSSSSSGSIVVENVYAGYKFYPTGTTTSYYANAQWVEQQPHDLTYKTGYSGGTPPASQTGIYSGTSVTLAAAIKRTGYTFRGWLLSHTGSIVSAGSSFSMPAQDVTATGQWTAQSVTITYYHGYDSGTYGTQSGTAGNTVTLKAAQTRSGYTFSGWLVKDEFGDDSSSRTYAAGASYELRSNATATALWTPSQVQTYTVSYDKNGSDVSGDAIPVVTVTKGNQTSVRGPDLWSRSGYQFVCWNTSSSGSGTEYQVGDMLLPTGNVILYAIWASDTRSGYQSSYSKTVYDTSYPQNNYMTQTPGATIAIRTNARETVNVTYETRTQGVGGYYSSGTSYAYRQTTYSSSGNKYSYSWPLSYGAKTTVTTSANQSVLYPGGTEISYYSYSYSGYDYTTHKSGMGSEYSRSNSLDDSWKWTAPVLANYEFQGWYTLDKMYTSAHSPTDNEFHLLVSKDRTIAWGDFKKKLNYVRHTAQTWTTGSYEYGYTNYLYLKYLGKKVAVLFDAGDGDVNPFFKEVRYDGQYGTLPTPTPPSGYTFSGWYTAATGGTRVYDTTVVATPSDHTLYARYTSSGTQTITVTFEGMGGTPSYSSRGYTPGSTYSTLPTGTLSGYSLDGWYTDAFAGSKVSTSTTVPSYAHTLYARWTKTMYTITFNPNGGTVSPSSTTVPAGSMYANLPVPLYSGKDFVGWFTAASGGSQIKVTDVPTASRTVYAQWTTTGATGAGETVAARGYVKFQINFVLNGGTLSSSYEKKYVAGYVKNLPTKTEVTRSGYTFGGWFENSSFSGTAVTQIPASATGVKTYYAKWS